MNAPEVSCEGCNAGVLVGFTCGSVGLPAGVVPVQCCDVCRRFPSDEAAAVDLARRWGSGWGLASDPTSPDTPCEWWVAAPDDAEFASESAAVQAWIDGDPVPCGFCEGVLAREGGAWYHPAPPEDDHRATPRLTKDEPGAPTLAAAPHRRTPPASDPPSDDDLGFYWVEHRDDLRAAWTRSEPLPVPWPDAVGQLCDAAENALDGADVAEPDDVSTECRDVLQAIGKGTLATAPAHPVPFTGRYLRITAAGPVLSDALAAQLRWWVVLCTDGLAAITLATSSGSTVRGTLAWDEIEPATVTIMRSGRPTVVRTDRIESFTIDAARTGAT